MICYETKYITLVHDFSKLFWFLSLHRRTSVRQYNEMDRNYIGSMKLNLLIQNDMNLMAKFFYTEFEHSLSSLII